MESKVIDFNPFCFNSAFNLSLPSDGIVITIFIASSTTWEHVKIVPLLSIKNPEFQQNVGWPGTLRFDPF